MSRTLVDSGIDWIGKIPSEWSVCKVKNKYNYHKLIANKNSEQYDRIALTLNGVIKRDKDDANGLQPENYDGYQIVYKNDLIFKLIDLENVNTSRIGKSSYEGITSPAYIILTPKDDNNYGTYYFLNMWYQEIFNNIGGNGVRSAINKDDLLNVAYLNVPIEQQTKIANYLDKKCSKIDEVIEDNNKEIKLLEEYRKSIAEDILKKYKPSPIKIKYLLEKSKIGIKTGPFGSSLTGKTLDYSDYLVYSQANLISNDFTFSKNYISEDTYNSLSSYAVNPGDVLLSMMGTIGKCKIISQNIKPGIMDSHIIKVRLDEEKICPEYFSLIYDKDNTNIVYNQLLYNSKGSIMEGLNTSIVKELLLPFLDISKQKVFVKEIELKREKLNKVIEYRKQIIEKLEEYKKSIIYEVVTGKKEV